MKVMLVEDDGKLAGLIADSLSRWEYEVDVVTGDALGEVVPIFVRSQPRLVLMDINLPYYDGFHWCREIRALSQVPIILISSRDSDMDVVMAVNMGGDDFIRKPFSMDLLIAKVKAASRRAYSYAAAPVGIMEHRGLILNNEDASLTYNGTKVELSKNEHRIIRLLLEAKGSIVSRDKLMDALWEGGEFVDDNTLAVNISRLRKRLADTGLPEFIETRKGQGYAVM